MSENTNPSISFLVSQWTVKVDNDKFIKNETRSNVGEIIRKVCFGTNCELEYDSESNKYNTKGNCRRTTLCTELRIIKDNLFLRRGTISETIDCIDFSKNLSNSN